MESYRFRQNRYKHVTVLQGHFDICIVSCAALPSETATPTNHSLKQLFDEELFSIVLVFLSFQPRDPKAFCRLVLMSTQQADHHPATMSALEKDPFYLR